MPSTVSRKERQERGIAKRGMYAETVIKTAQELVDKQVSRRDFALGVTKCRDLMEKSKPQEKCLVAQVFAELTPRLVAMEQGLKERASKPKPVDEQQA